MPDGRFLSKTVATDEPLNRLTWQAQAVYMMTVPHLDRDGLITGHPLLLMAQVAPLRAAELVGIMPGIIQEWSDAELVTCYHAGEPVLFFPGFLKHQRLPHYDRETPSRFAPPPGYQRTDHGLIPVEQPAAPAAAHSVQPVQLPPDSGATPDSLRTQSGPTPPIKQQKDRRNQESKSPHVKSSSNSTTRARARPSPPAAPAARSPGQIKPEIYEALKDFGVAEPALSEITSNGVTPDQVDGWIAYMRTQTNMQRPVGYLVKRLRAHEQPPPAAAAEQDDPDSYEALKRRYVPAGLEDIVQH
jgi:hypothetical protein